MLISGRNPFKNLSSKLVDRVRRSLSRTGRTSRDRTPEAPLATNEEISPLDEDKPPIGSTEIKVVFQAISLKSHLFQVTKLKVKSKKSSNGVTKSAQKKPTVV